MLKMILVVIIQRISFRMAVRCPFRFSLQVPITKCVNMLHLLPIFGLLVAVPVFLDAVFSAPEGEQTEEGFVPEPWIRRQLLPVESCLLKSDHCRLVGLSGNDPTKLAFLVCRKSVPRTD